jgi:hypothetical protein
MANGWGCGLSEGSHRTKKEPHPGTISANAKRTTLKLLCVSQMRGDTTLPIPLRREESYYQNSTLPINTEKHSLSEIAHQCSPQGCISYFILCRRSRAQH